MSLRFLLLGQEYLLALIGGQYGDQRYFQPAQECLYALH